MAFVGELWLPILLSAVFVFVVSSVVHMVLPHHKSDYEPLPGEADIQAEMRKQGVQPGNYTMPHCKDMKLMGTPEVQKKYNDGPVAFLFVVPNGPPPMGKALFQWFVYTIVVSLFAAYIASLALAPGARYLDVFQIVGAVTFLAYGIANIPSHIWKAEKASTTLKFMFDGLLYSLVTAGAFGWLWPGA